MDAAVERNHTHTTTTTTTKKEKSFLHEFESPTFLGEGEGVERLAGWLAGWLAA